MRAILSVRPKCSHRCVSRKETPLKPVQILKHAPRKSTQQTSMRTEWLKHIAIQTVQEHLLSGRLIFIHFQCWEVPPFFTIQRQRCIKFLCPKDPEFCTPLALKCQKGQHLPVLEVYKSSLPLSITRKLSRRIKGTN